MHMDISEGSYGARWAKDGMDAMDMLFSNTRCAPVEEIETEYPLRFVRWELNDYAVGHGRFRGGKGGLRDLQFLVDGYISSEADGHVKAPWGFAGGTDGHAGEMWANPESEAPERLTSKLTGRPATAGEVYRVVAPNGGGAGDPAEREPGSCSPTCSTASLDGGRARDLRRRHRPRRGEAVRPVVPPPRETTRTPMTVYAILERAAERDPGGVFYRKDDEGVELTFAGVKESADWTARRLALGLSRGDRIVVWLPNGPLWIALLFASARLGVTLVSAGARLRMVDMPYLIGHAKARAIFYTPEFLDTDYEAMVLELRAIRDRGELPELHHLVRCGGPAQDTPGITTYETLQERADLPPGPGPDDECLICYTGGTTGRPKGCVHDHRTIVRNCEIASGLTGFAEGERLVSAMPFSHVFGFHMGILQPMLRGASLVEAEPFDPGRVLDLVERHRGTVVYGVPAMGQDLVSEQRAPPRDLSSLRVALLAGAPVPPKLRKQTTEILGCDVTVVYGATESPTLTQLLPAIPPLRCSSRSGGRRRASSWRSSSRAASRCSPRARSARSRRAATTT